MARTRKGRPLTGWIAVDKPAGVTSAAVVNRIRWQLKAQKAGHAGTLDPSATGLLVLALGEATKAVSTLTDALKTYEFDVAWGAATDTDDADGTVIETSPQRPTPAEIEAALPAFRGDITQVPPQVSAVKVDGARAYDLAREGAVLELAARPLHVAELTLEAATVDTARLRMVCGKGGYVRSIARDLGRMLGCLGHVATLRRTTSGAFDLTDAYPFDPDGPDQDPRLAAAIRPLADGLGHLPRSNVGAEGAIRLANGNPAEVTWTEASQGETSWASDGTRALALGTYLAGRFTPDRVFNAPSDRSH